MSSRDQSLNCVAEVAENMELSSRCSRVCPEAGERIGKWCISNACHDATSPPLQETLARREGAIAARVAVTNDQIRFVPQNRRDQLVDTSAVVLIVSIGVHDHVCPGSEARFDADRKRLRESSILGQADHMIGTMPGCYLAGAVCRAVVDNENLDRVEPVDRARKRGECRGQRFRFVEAWNLDDQLHVRSSRRWTRDESAIRRLAPPVQPSACHRLRE